MFERLEICQGEGYGANEIILTISASEKHNLLNSRMSHAQAMTEHASLMKRAHALGIRIIGCTGTFYSCPVKGDVTTDEAAKIVKFYLNEGARTIMLGDTAGAANPKLVLERVGDLMARFPNAKFIVHFHDTRGTGIVTSIVMLEVRSAMSTAPLGLSADNRRRARLFPCRWHSTERMPDDRTATEHLKERSTCQPL